MLNISHGYLFSLCTCSLLKEKPFENRCTYKSCGFRKHPPIPSAGLPQARNNVEGKHEILEGRGKARELYFSVKEKF